MSDYLIDPTASGAWALSRRNDNGKFSHVGRYETEAEAEAVAAELEQQA